MECNKAAKNIAGCPSKREVGKNHGLKSASGESTLQVVEEVMCHDTPFAQRRVVQDVFMSK